MNAVYEIKLDIIAEEIETLEEELNKRREEYREIWLKWLEENSKTSEEN